MRGDTQALTESEMMEHISPIPPIEEILVGYLKVLLPNRQKYCEYLSSGD